LLQFILNPTLFDSDREVMHTATKVIPNFMKEKARVVQIKNTLDLKEMLISEAMIPDVAVLENVRIIGIPNLTEFGEKGNLAD
jgi:hypothetical protein